MATSFIAFGVALAGAPVGSADPTDPVDTEAPDIPAAAAGLPVPAEVTAEALNACSQFSDALNSAANYYSDFANNIAGEGPADYSSPVVAESNVFGRTALRGAAAEALSASNTPGLQGDIAAPMQSWSGNVTKLMVLMGVHSPRETINQAATDVNTDTDRVNAACTAAGVHG